MDFKRKFVIYIQSGDLFIYKEKLNWQSPEHAKEPGPSSRQMKSRESGQVLPNAGLRVASSVASDSREIMRPSLPGPRRGALLPALEDFGQSVEARSPAGCDTT